MARLTCSVRVVQQRIESRLWMEKLEDQLMPDSGKQQRGMRWPLKVRKGPFVSGKSMQGWPFLRRLRGPQRAGSSNKMKVLPRTEELSVSPRLRE